MNIALRKRNVDPDMVQQRINRIVRGLESQGEGEIQSEQIGNSSWMNWRKLIKWRMCAMPRSIAISAKPKISAISSKMR